MAQKQIKLLRSGSGGAKPNASAIETGELAINYKADSEKLQIKNSLGIIVEFETSDKIINKVKSDIKMSDIKLPTGGSDGQVLKKSGNTLVWADDNAGGGESTDTITTITGGSGITVSDSGTSGNHNYNLSVDVNAVITPIQKQIFPSGGASGQVLKLGSSGELVWAEDEKGSGGLVTDNNTVTTIKSKEGILLVTETDDMSKKEYSVGVDIDYIKSQIGAQNTETILVAGDGIALKEEAGTNKRTYTVSANAEEIIPGDGNIGQILTKTSKSFEWMDAPQPNIVWSQTQTEGNIIATLKIDKQEAITIYTPPSKMTTVSNGTGILITDSGDDNNHKYSVAADMGIISSNIFPTNKSAGKLLKIDSDGSTLTWGEVEALPTSGKSAGKVLKIGNDGNTPQWGDDISGISQGDADKRYVLKSGDTITGRLKIGTNAIILDANGEIATQTTDCDFYVGGSGIHMGTNGGSNFIMKPASDRIECENTDIVARAFYEWSDANLKENIKQISDLDKIKNVNFKEFNFKSDKSKTKMYGVIAQEVEKAELDNLVTTNDNGTKSVDYISLLCLKIAQLEDKIKDLESMIK